MRKLLLLIPLLIASAAAQVTNNNKPDCVQGFAFLVNANVITQVLGAGGVVNSGSAGISTPIDNRSVQAGVGGCTNWTLVYSASTTGISALSIELDQAPDSSGQPGTFAVWPSANVIGTQPITTATFSQITAYGFAPWVAIKLNSATGTGIVYGNVYGWRTQGSSDSTSGATPVNPAVFAYRHISTATNTQVKSSGGYVHTVSINGGTAGIVTVVDTSAANCSGGTTVAVIETIAATNPTSMTFDAIFNTGICVITGAASDVTVSFK
jgi:hypothetical protein